MSWRNTRDYRVWRALVIRRDKLCAICGGRLQRQAHHINSGAYFKELRFSTKNGVCLCRKCHTQFHTNYKRSFREKCTETDFNNFVSIAKYFKEVYAAD